MCRSLFSVNDVLTHLHLENQQNLEFDQGFICNGGKCKEFWPFSIIKFITKTFSLHFKTCTVTAIRASWRGFQPRLHFETDKIQSNSSIMFNISVTSWEWIQNYFIQKGCQVFALHTARLWFFRSRIISVSLSVKANLRPLTTTWVSLLRRADLAFAFFWM